jgi:hypothetical protein
MAMRDFRTERTRRAGVREERLRATAGLRSSPALSSWRGRSGRRYVVGVHPLLVSEVLDVDDAVLLAVRRDANGAAILVAKATAGPGFVVEARRLWLGQAQTLGATEMHVHRLAADESERRAIMADLDQDAAKAAC